MSNEVIDEMTAIIASLTARVDELELQLNDYKEKGNAVASDDKMYDGVITTLQSDLYVLRNNEMHLSAENIALARKVSSLTEEYQIATLTKYCRECGESTHHEDDWCVQCLIREKGSCSGVSEHTTDHTADANYRVELALERELGVASSPENNTVIGSVEVTDDENANGELESIISKDEIIAGYQKVILALTHKLAEAYGVNK